MCSAGLRDRYACALAAWADDPARGAALLVERWTGLSLDDVIRVDRKRTFNMFRALLGWSPRKPSDSGEARGGMLDARPLEALLSSTIDFERIGAHLAAGRLQAVSVTATHVGSGRTSVFYQEQPGCATRWEGGHLRAQPVTLGQAHALASASIPFLFPAVAIGSDLYCDGSLRQHVPLSPARHLGAHALVVVNPRAPREAEAAVAGERAAADAEAAETIFLGPLYLLGKTMNALTIDRIDAEIEQLRFVNRMLAAGERAFGGRFLRSLNAALAEDGAPAVTPVSLLHIHASEDIGRLAADFVRSARFRARSHSLLARAFGRLADGEAADEADLLSYVLFDGEFTQEADRARPPRRRAAARGDPRLLRSAARRGSQHALLAIVTPVTVRRGSARRALRGSRRRG